MQAQQSIESVLDTQQKKLAFFQNLIILAVADGKFDEEEGRFLLTIGNRLGLRAEEVMPLADNVKVLSFVIPEEGIQKTMELQTLVMLMLQDGKIHDREYLLCLEYARRVGYSKDILEEMVERLSNDQASSQ